VLRIFKKNRLLQKGFTLVELLISMAFFIIIMIIASEAFNKIIAQSSKFSKMEESNIEGVIGLEVMRHDLEQTGFGLPWSWSFRNNSTLSNSSLTYAEATDASGLRLNDAPNGVPRAFVAYAKLGTFSSAYIAIKGTTVGRAKAAQLWTYIPYMNYSANPRESRPVAFASRNPKLDNMVLMVNSNPTNEDLDHTLVVGPGGSTFSTQFKNSGIDVDYLPTDQNNTYMVYGLLDDISTTPRMPFNRTDFFIGGNLDGNVVPSFCAPRTGILYKATVKHGSSTGGDYNYIPLLDCVADMQVVLGWDPEVRPASERKNSSVDAYSTLSNVFGGTVSASVTSVNPAITASGTVTNIQTWLTDPKGLREQLKVVKVYILAQEGKIDRNYRAPSANIVIGDAAADGFTAKTYVLSAEQLKYRWKLYRIIVRPKNLVSNSY